MKVNNLLKNLVENNELRKENWDYDRKVQELENDHKSVKEDYEMRIKLVEDRIVQRESKGEARRVAELKRNYEIEM